MATGRFGQVVLVPIKLSVVDAEVQQFDPKGNTKSACSSSLLAVIEVIGKQSAHI